MLKNSVAYIDVDGTEVERRPSHRNRTVKLLISEVTINAKGDLTHRRVTMLSCFADPVEYHRGEFDEHKPRYKDHQPAPQWCAGCLSRPACATFAHQRVDLDSELAGLRDAWEDGTRGISGTAKYGHHTFGAFAAACRKRDWTSSSLEEQAKRRAAKRGAAKAKRALALREVDAKAVTERHLKAFENERQDRQRALERAVREPGAPAWLCKLTERSVELTCDAWQVRAAIERRWKGSVTAGDVARSMRDVGRSHGLPDNSLRSRVYEAVERIELLEHGSGGASVWGQFWAASNQLPKRNNLHGVGRVVLEDDEG